MIQGAPVLFIVKYSASDNCAAYVMVTAQSSSDRMSNDAVSLD